MSSCILDAAGPQDSAAAWRFLTQATFGPSQGDAAHLTDIGYAAWIDEQLAMPAQGSYRDFIAARDAEIKAANPSNSPAKAGQEQIVEAFYTHALTDPAQLRQRLTFALSEIFVVSLQDGRIADHPQLMATYLDTLNNSLSGTYRDLLESVTKTPAMGEYLTYRSNQREDPTNGRIPDENYAREVMQLFSIGLVELNLNGTPVLDARTQTPKPTYTSADVQGLAKVFTGWSNYRGAAYASQPVWTCFWIMAECADPEGELRLMVSYPPYHSVSEKKFLGVTIAAQSTPDPEGDLKIAMDRLASHPNTAPFFCKQLIKRLVTSNPSPEYVQRVAQRFRDTGGSLPEVTKAILMDDEARSPDTFFTATGGKIREPILRLTALLRAFTMDAPGLLPATGSPSKIKTAGITSTSDNATSLGQSPVTAPSVFNFFRPGYVPPQSVIAEHAGMVAPEMQLVSESSVTGYVNAIADLLDKGIGYDVQTALGPRPSIRLDLSEPRALAQDAATLADDVSRRLLGTTMTSALRQQILIAVNSIAVPPLDATRSNVAAVNAALDQRVKAAILITAASSEFLVQR
ncbi:MAG: DUF1800 domain-containing protein [Burkholderiales bacterium]|nr:DUF1800 domain-containing protein [Burkholderiales bacterium]